MSRLQFSTWLGLIALAAIIFRLAPGPKIIDDAYITFRYARNLADGYGLVYNRGEAVYGTTSPLWAITLALAHKVTGVGYIRLAWFLNALLGGISCVFLGLAARRLADSSIIALASASLLAFSSIGVLASISGMETPLYLSALIAAYWCYLADRPALAGLAGGIAVLTRIDGALLPCLLLAGLLFQRSWRGLLGFAIVFLVTVSPWVIYAQRFYGTIIPHTAIAKWHAYFLPPDQAFLVISRYLLGLINPDTNSLAHLFAVAPISSLAGLFALMGLWLIGAAQLVRKNPRFWPIILHPFLVAGGLIIANPPIFFWYLAPIEPIFTVCALTGVTRLTQAAAFLLVRMRGDLPQSWQEPAVRVGGAIAAAILFSIFAVRDANSLIRPVNGHIGVAPPGIWLSREQKYRQIAKVLDARMHPNDILCATEIGVLGYYCPVRILDAVGLVSPQCDRFYPTSRQYLDHNVNYAVPPKLIRTLRPTFFVSFDTFIKNGVLRSRWFLSHYRLIGRIGGGPFESRYLDIFERADVMARRRDRPLPVTSHEENTLTPF
ncbi:MAG: hypothetical protein M1330_02375 [Armatimonadetes bacterium]|nr:hypothetical protein [Armatimonadota bacterium]